jgi:hypothetical protein
MQAINLHPRAFRDSKTITYELYQRSIVYTRDRHQKTRAIVESLADSTVRIVLAKCLVATIQRPKTQAHQSSARSTP